MDKRLNREILRLAIPSILANITVPLVGMVDTAVAGHLTARLGKAAAGTEFTAAAYIGGIAVGSMMLNLMYWMMGFLRTSTGGLTAQAFGRMASGGGMSPASECGRICVRAIIIALAAAALMLLLQHPLAQLGALAVKSTPEVLELALRYFCIRIWAAPATLSLMAFRGWFVGMQDSLSSMFTDLVINITNIAASICLSFGLAGIPGMGFDGIATGTVIAQYTGLAVAAGICFFRYGRRYFEGLRWNNIFRKAEMRDFGALNADMTGRSVCFIAIYMGYTAIAAGFGDIYLACSSIMMTLLMFFSFFTDGFAYAGEALTGRYIGEKNTGMLKKSISHVFFWSMGVALIWVAIYVFGGHPLLKLLSSDSQVVESCRQFLPWLILMPPVGCAAFTWDGVYMGATASKAIRDSMIWALVSFLGLWFIGKALLHPQGAGCLHLLMAAYFAHLLARTLCLTLRYPRHSSFQKDAL